jgi:hypothetical protein
VDGSQHVRADRLRVQARDPERPQDGVEEGRSEHAQREREDQLRRGARPEDREGEQQVDGAHGTRGLDVQERAQGTAVPREPV